ncbi:nocobactin polyketide synthase NbtC [Nocardia sp. 2YAB30]|uniref:nocobactin polyketide synthase NbtC n=1 Tax=unclassified Nocardia TaxID=2637762 RepID=UPI003F9E8C65
MSRYLLPDGSIPILLSSDTEDSLRREAAALVAYLEARPGIMPQQVADMLFRTRVPRRMRALAMVTGHDELVAALRATAAGDSHPAVLRGANPATARKVGYVFPGQGSQRPGMGSLHYKHSPVYRAAVDECEALFQELYRISPLAYLLDEGGTTDDVRIVQPALFVQMIGLAAMWRAAGVAPAVTIGHSQGEIAAACVSGVMGLADGVRVVTLRANLVDTVSRERGFADSYSMAVVGVDREECERLLARNSGWAELSVVNSAHVLAISGEREMVTEVVATLNQNGKFAKEIRVSYPAHTSYVSKFRTELCDSLVGELDNPVFQPTEIDCIGAALGAPITPDLPVGDYWYWNLRNKVRFDLAIAAAAERGVDTFVEIADHPTLMLAVQENLSTLAPPRDYQTVGTSRRTAENLREFTRNLATVAVHDQNYPWEALRAGAGDEPIRLPLLDFPNTQMNSKKLWARFDYHPELAAPGGGGRRLAAPQRLVEEWVRLDRRKLVKPRTLALVDPTGRCTELADAVRAAAPRHGAKVVDPAQGAADTVAVLLSRSPDGDTASAVAELAEFLGDRAWLPELDGVADLWLVTTGGEQIGAGEVPDAFHAAAQAGFRALATEHRGTAFRHVDLGPGDAVAESAKALVGALHLVAEPEIACRAGGVHVKRLVADEDDLGEPLRAAELREVVIIGGTGKLGLEFCDHFARNGAGRITLISRSGGDAEARARIERMRGPGGAEIVVRACDITEEDQVRALADEYRTRPATLIVHAAVNYAVADEAGAVAVRAAAAPKIIGLDHVVRLVPRTDDGRVVLFSSLTATLGGRGNMIYGALNRMLDAAAIRLRAEGIACTSVQWGLWPEVGAGREDALARTDGASMPPMDPARAIELGLRTEPANRIVAAMDWSTLRSLSGIYGLTPLFERLKTEAPEVAARPATEPVAPGPAPAPEPSGENTADRVRFALREVMGMDTAETIDGATPLVALGLDSLQALDLRKRIESELQRDLPVTAILGGASLDEVVSLLGR